MVDTVAHAMAARRRTRMALPMGMGRTQAGTVVLTAHALAIIAHRRHLRRTTTTVVPGRSTIGSWARAFRRSTAARVMWSVTGAVTGCTSRHVATTGCGTAGTTCWWPLPRA